MQNANRLAHNTPCDTPLTTEKGIQKEKLNRLQSSQKLCKPMPNDLLVENKSQQHKQQTQT